MQSPLIDVGLALDQESFRDEMLAPDSIYSTRVGSLDDGEAAIVSAMVAVTANGPEVLWEQAFD
jgi:hypothetical protein